MANAILLNQTNFTKDNILKVLKKSVVSDIKFENNIFSTNNKSDLSFEDVKESAENGTGNGKKTLGKGMVIFINLIFFIFTRTFHIIKRHDFFLILIY